jgi:hypothetical protein
LRTGSPPKSGEVVITLSELKSDVPDGSSASEDGQSQLIVEFQHDQNRRRLDLYWVEFAKKLTFFRAHELTLIIEDEVADETVTVT